MCLLMVFDSICMEWNFLTPVLLPNPLHIQLSIVTKVWCAVLRMMQSY